MIKELTSVVLKVNQPRIGLKRGDVGTVVLVHGAGIGYEVEFVTLNGETLAVISLAPDQIRAIGRREIAHVRTVAAQAP